jgi:hypothetical protein
MKVGGRRNFGYGKRLAWAGANALHDRYGEGCYGTRAAHAARWRLFAQFAQHQAVKDARDVTAELIERFGRSLSARVGVGELSVRYAQNLLSTVNVVLETMRGDRTLRIAPAALVGQRRSVRAAVPVSLDRSRVDAAIARAVAAGEERTALVAALARELGLRFREASLLDSRAALKEVAGHGAVNIVAGTKGGRGKHVDRWVPVSERALTTLREAARLQGCAANLIPADRDYRQWREHAYHVWQRVAAAQGIRGFHDLRAAHACERYASLTGNLAPVVAGQRRATKHDDTAARVTLAHELGPGRTDVLAAYVGSSR